MGPVPGSGQAWRPERYVRHAAYVAEYGRELLSLLAPAPGEAVLDLGCGDGRLTAELARAGCRVVGIDSSPEQVAAARARGLDARVGSGLDLPFDAEFDAVFSNAALHWMRPPEAVVASVHRALRPGGRFVGELGGAGNIAALRRGLSEALSRRGLAFDRLSPWYYPTVDEYRALLEAGGFAVDAIRLFPRPTPIPTDVVGWLETFGEAFASALPEGDRDAFRGEVQEAVGPELRTPDGSWFVDYVRLRFRARKG